MRRPWFKFYSGDWRADPGLRSCSLAARGLWIDLLTIMHEATPYGHLLINGKPPSYYRISQIVGTDYRVVKNLVAELKRNGVFTSGSTGEITSRRMVRDEAKRFTAREVSKKRWGAGPNAPESRKKERGSTKGRGFAKAQHVVLTILSRDLGVTYAEAMELLGKYPDVCERATRAEMRKPGSGAYAAAIGIRQHMRAPPC